MKNTKVTVTEQGIDTYRGNLLVFCVAQQEDGTYVCDPDIRPLLDSSIQYEDFTAKENETVLFYPGDLKRSGKISAKRVLAIGLGKLNNEQDKFDEMEIFRSVGGSISKICAKLKVSELRIANIPELGLKQALAAECLTEGIILGDYQFLKYKAEDKENPAFPGIKKLQVTASGKVAVLRRAVKRGSDVAKAACAARDMANEPGNMWTAASFAEYAMNLAENSSVTCKVLDKARIKKTWNGRNHSSKSGV